MVVVSSGGGGETRVVHLKHLFESFVVEWMMEDLNDGCSQFNAYCIVPKFKLYSPVFVGCESSPISRNVQSSVRPSVDKCKIRLNKAKLG